MFLFQERKGSYIGYTHYWKKTGKVDEKEYAGALLDIAKIVKSQEKLLANGVGEEGTKPNYTNGISFNGIRQFDEDNAHETFSIPKTASSLQEFDFCKTAQKPYDVVVTAVLTRLAEVKGIKVSSDGNPGDWNEGVQLASKVLKRKLKNPMALLKEVKSFFYTKIQEHKFKRR
jgi:hypothetical protein